MPRNYKLSDKGVCEQTAAQKKKIRDNGIERTIEQIQKLTKMHNN